MVCGLPWAISQLSLGSLSQNGVLRASVFETPFMLLERMMVHYSKAHQQRASGAFAAVLCTTKLMWKASGLKQLPCPWKLPIYVLPCLR